MVEIIMSYNELDFKENKEFIIKQIKKLINSLDISNLSNVRIKIGISKVNEKYD